MVELAARDRQLNLLELLPGLSQLGQLLRASGIPRDTLNSQMTIV